MFSKIITYLGIILSIYVGFSSIKSFVRKDNNEWFLTTTAESWIVKKTIGKKNYIRWHNLIFGLISLSIGSVLLYLKLFNIESISF